MMQSGGPGTGLNSLLMSLGGSLSLQSEGSFVDTLVTTDSEFSRLFDQLKLSGLQLEDLPVSLQQAGLDSNDMSSWTEQDWLQLQQVLQQHSGIEGGVMPQAGQPLPVEVSDLLQQVQYGEELLANTDTPSSLDVLANASVSSEQSQSRIPVSAAEWTSVSATDVEVNSLVEQGPVVSDTAFSAIAGLQTQASDTEKAAIAPTPVEPQALANVAAANSRLPLHNSGKNNQRDMANSTLNRDSSPITESTTSADVDRPTDAQIGTEKTTMIDADSSLGERVVQSNQITVTTGDNKPPTAALNVGTQPATVTASLANDSVEPSNPVTEEAFELQEKRELQQVRGEERLRDRLELGSDRQTWGSALGGRILTMVQDDIQHARIQLDPPELGSMEIRLQVQQDQTTVQVQVQSPQVRDALEANAHRLREALADNGLALAGFDVAEQSQQQAQQQQYSASGESASVEDDEMLQQEGPSNSQATTARSDALLDTFA